MWQCASVGRGVEVWARGSRGDFFFFLLIREVFKNVIIVRGKVYLAFTKTNV